MRIGRGADAKTVEAAIRALKATEEAEQIEAAGEEENEQAAATKRLAKTAKRRANRGSLPAHLPRVEMVVDIEDHALHNWCDHVWYTDAFAGTGRRTVRVKARAGDLLEEPAPEQVEQRRGSAQIAIDITPPFDRLVFMTRRKHVAAISRILSRALLIAHKTKAGDPKNLADVAVAMAQWYHHSRHSWSCFMTRAGHIYRRRDKGPRRQFR